MTKSSGNRETGKRRCLLMAGDDDEVHEKKPQRYAEDNGPVYGQSLLSVLHLALGAFTARDIARYWLKIAIFAYSTCIPRPS